MATKPDWLEALIKSTPNTKDTVQDCINFDKQSIADVLQLIKNCDKNCFKKQIFLQLIQESLANGTLDPEHLECLLDAGMSPNYRDSDGYSLLHVSSLAGNADYCRILIDYGAQVNKHSMEGTTPIESAAVNGEVMVAQILLDAGAEILPQSTGTSAIHEATFRGHYSCLEFLLNHVRKSRMLINHLDSHLGSPLQAAALSNCTDQLSASCARLLIYAGADVNQCSLNTTPLHNACQSEKYSLAALLIQCGADCRAVDCNYKTPLCYIDEKLARIREQLVTYSDDSYGNGDRIKCVNLQHQLVQLEFIYDMLKKFSKPVQSLQNLARKSALKFIVDNYNEVFKRERRYSSASSLSMASTSSSAHTSSTAGSSTISPYAWSYLDSMNLPLGIIQFLKFYDIVSPAPIQPDIS